MESFADMTPLWDLSQPVSFSQLPDDDFLALLQKQFPTPAQPQVSPLYLPNNGLNSLVNPQTLSKQLSPTHSSPSENDSPSPPVASSSKAGLDDDDYHDSALKRKASGDESDSGQGSKSAKKSSAAPKRKNTTSSGSPDETRLTKRKEQNRAAQRAFRERKEKHVKDLEDKVAELQAKNDETSTENENLKDLLQRLQKENMSLKENQSTFTFTVPKNAGSISGPLFSTDASMFSNLSRASYHGFDNLAQPSMTDPIDYSSSQSFNPEVLKLLENIGTGDSMNVDFSGGDDDIFANLTTLADNPTFFSTPTLFSTEEPTPPPASALEPNSFNFNMNAVGVLSNWPSPSTLSQDTGNLDDLFGSYLGSEPMDMNFGSFLSPGSSLSPVLHQQSPNYQNFSIPSTSPQDNSSNTTGSSPESNASEPSLFSATVESASSSSSEMGHQDMHGHGHGNCPKTKEEARQHIETEGYSPFAPTIPTLLAIRGAKAGAAGVPCGETSSWPNTEQNESNVDVLSAWRSITANFKDKDININDLCEEFSSKARCDGSKKVEKQY